MLNTYMIWFMQENFAQIMFRLSMIALASLPVMHTWDDPFGWDFFQ
jgi:hypothetical protein